TSASGSGITIRSVRGRGLSMELPPRVCASGLARRSGLVVVIGLGLGLCASGSLADGHGGHGHPSSSRDGGPPRLIQTRVVARYGAGRYRDPAGWVIRVPRGWHVLQFKETKTRVPVAGAQVSDGRLP